jgi:hypothetical protein
MIELRKEQVESILKFTQYFAKECIRDGENSHEILYLMGEKIEACQTLMLCMMASLMKKEKSASFYKQSVERSLSAINRLIDNPDILSKCPIMDDEAGEAIPEIISILKGLRA